MSRQLSWCVGWAAASLLTGCLQSTRIDDGGSADATVGTDATTTSAPDSSNGPHCEGPFVPWDSNDTCTNVHPSWDVRNDVRSVEACFELCAQDADCRVYGIVDYHPQRHRCILNSSCSPTGAGYVPYEATGGCTGSR